MEEKQTFSLLYEKKYAYVVLINEAGILKIKRTVYCRPVLETFNFVLSGSRLDNHHHLAGF